MSTTLVVLSVLAGLAVVVLALGLTGPRSFRLARSTHIAAPPERIYPLIDDFHAWTKWSPFEKLDADLKRGYHGAASGLGAGYSWAGRKSGAGSMDIIEAVAARKIGIDLKFERPMKAHNLAEFTLAPDASGTIVTWAMSGPQPFLSRAMTKFVSMDRMVGGMFEDGLAAMKKTAEAPGPAL